MSQNAHIQESTHCLPTERVSDAVAAWESTTAATGWRQFQDLNASVSINATSSGIMSAPGGGLCGAASRTLPLTSATCPADVYTEEASRFQGVKQLSFCAWLDFSLAVQACGMRVSFHVQQPGGSSVTTLATVNNLVTMYAGTVDIKMNEIGGPNKCSGSSKCYGTEFNRCRDRCQSSFGGTFSCGGGWSCRTVQTHVSSLAVKIKYTAGSATAYSSDTAYPSMGAASAGANVLPSGFTWTPLGALLGLKGAAWTYEGLTYNYQPTSVLLRIRASSDPWLKYMEQTGGSGSFGLNKKQILGFGIALVVIGASCLLSVLIVWACCWYGMKLAREHPNERPAGSFKASAWSWGSMMLGTYQQQLPATSVIPMAPVVAQPAPGIPATSYYQLQPQNAPLATGAAPSVYYFYSPAPGVAPAADMAAYPPPPGVVPYPPPPGAVSYPPPPGAVPYPPSTSAAAQSQSPGAYYAAPNQSQQAVPYYPPTGTAAPYGSAPPPPPPGANPPNQLDPNAPKY
ncbi:hypothetical protein GPECTOR_67g271 [Gonium pectorale]|uniref:Uncharacterized protein n=1 Tax=Gonium pectorale TaxID=33097 RepID=A0A150G3P8_GONPE|nr:hypothetical protein GPECTOR_67g271 [Gonium pectorale]|eukprot:KXZ44431.1 hypothetical protein GPECTOR_67g271 [Gonium pectorale]